METSMFGRFLIQYIKDLNDCWSEELPDLKQDEIMKIVDDVEYNDYFWEILDEIVFDGLDEVRRKREGGE